MFILRGLKLIHDEHNHDTPGDKRLVKVARKKTVMVKIMKSEWDNKKKIHGNGGRQSKSSTSCFSPSNEASEWEDTSQGCFARYHQYLLCAVLEEKLYVFFLGPNSPTLGHCVFWSSSGSSLQNWKQSMFGWTTQQRRTQNMNVHNWLRELVYQDCFRLQLHHWPFLFQWIHMNG